MANEIRIDDLASPVLNDIQQMGLDYGEAKATVLTVDAVCEAAVARTGLHDFGPTTSVTASGSSWPRWTPTTSAPGSAGC